MVDEEEAATDSKGDRVPQDFEGFFDGGHERKE
jgi:hypothetical protein